MLIICGLPSSGKTTVARAVAKLLEDKHEIPTFIVSSDDFRQMASSSDRGFKPEREKTIKEFYLKTIASALEKGFIVISDDLNYYKSMRSELRGIAKKSGVKYDIVFVDTPVDVAIEWNRRRGEPIPASLIEEVNQKMDRPDVEYKWDTAIATVDPSKENQETNASIIAVAVLKRLKSQKAEKPAKTAENQKTLTARAIERETRRAMMEVMARYKNADLALTLSRIRKKVAKKALVEDLQPLDAVAEFLNCANIAAEDFAVPEAKDLIPVHVGLFGHVDHGKTMLARRLTEKLSTAALDKAPDSIKRGMTLDIGFSACRLGDYLVTLVDLPGHYSLIKHAVAGANIIDIAVLVVAADEGLQIQSIEHFSIIKNIGIKNLLVALNKTDTANADKIEGVKKKIAILLRGTAYENCRIVCISSLTGEGIQELKVGLHELLKSPVRQWVGPFKMPIDHAFTIAGSGTVLTGTIHRGKIKLQEPISVEPIGKKGKVRSLRSFGEDKNEAIAGERVGVAVRDIKPEDAHRGYVACALCSVKSASRMLVELKLDKLYQRGLKLKSRVTAFVGLCQVLVTVIPCVVENDRYLVNQSVKSGESCMVYLELKQPVVAERGDRVVLLNSGLPPHEFRVIGGGKVIELGTKPEFYAKKVKTGIITDMRKNGDYAINGLFGNIEAASRYLDKEVTSVSQVKGKIVATANSTGDVFAKFERRLQVGDRVFLVRYKKLAL